MALLVLVSSPQYNRYPESRGDGGLRGTCISLMFFELFSNKSDPSESELEIGKKVILTHSQKEMEG